ncbi:hypothetical protein GCM10023100_69320 [Actinocorallia cavernae]|uniref:Uncharacterized protein n=2 Tax=Actinomycetes TaxID=1760 RepID=A0ABN3LCN7_9ACTN
MVRPGRAVLVEDHGVPQHALDRLGTLGRFTTADEHRVDIGVPAGAVLTMMLTRRLCRRYGSHPVTVVWMVVLALSVALRKTLTRP